MLRKIRVFLFSLLVLFGVLFISNVEVKATTVTTVNVYYHLYSGNYSGCWVWFWSEHRAGGDFGGKTLQTVNNDPAGYTKKATFTINSDEQNDKFGVIFVKSSGVGSWDGEQTGDLYFYIEDFSSNTINVYYAEGETEVVQTTEKAKEIKQNKFTYISFTDLKTISFKATGNVSNVEVKADGTKVNSTLGSGKITLSENIDVTKEYTISAKVGSDQVTNKQIAFIGIYSGTAFGNAFNYSVDDLGANYSKSSTTFKLWAPLSKSITLKLYHYGHAKKYGTTKYPGDDTPYETHVMTKGEKGVWSVTVKGDLDGVYYLYDVTNGATTNADVVDPYAKSTGLNGMRGMVVNFNENNDKLNPDNWASTERAPATTNNTDKILYETHIRDLTASSTWGGDENLRGTYLGFAQTGTTYKGTSVTVKTGLDHIIELGVTHVHLLPLMDAGMVDETMLDNKEYIARAEDGIYNWGYMTKSFFTVEGAYSTDPYDGYVRLKEYKSMIQTMHKNGLNIVMDVVFNHTANSSNSSFQLILPYYFYRTSNGYFTNGSGCGNEVASERYMASKLIQDSCNYFASEFKVDGYRFDLMGLEDTNTMNAVKNNLNKINPNNIIYGEPWGAGSLGGYDPNAGGSGWYTPADKGNANKITGIGEFADASKEGLRGENDVPARNKGWVNGNSSMYDKAAWGIFGGSGYFNSASTGYTFTNPGQIINFASCHDNYSLFDQYSMAGATSANAIKQATQALSMVLTSQGVPFIEGGSETFRTKIYNGQANHNSYNLSDKTNAIDYKRKADNYTYFTAIKNMVYIRRAHSAFKQTTYSAIGNVTSSNNGNAYFNNGNVIGFRLKDSKDSWNDIYVISANSSGGGFNFNLPSGSWLVAASTNAAHRFNSKFTSSIQLAANETVVLVNSTTNLEIEAPNKPVQETKYDVTLTYNSNQGTVKADKGLTGLAANTKVTFTVTPKEGYQFAGIKIDGKTVSGATLDANGKYTLSVSKSSKIEFLFAAETTYTVTLATNSTATVVADKELTGLKKNSTVTFTVTPKAGYEFSAVKVDGKTVSGATLDANNQYTLTVTKNTKIEFICKAAADPTYNVGLEFDNTQGSVTADKALTNVKKGTKVTFTVTPQSGYKFSAVKVDGVTQNVTLTNGKFSLTVSKDMNVQVLFEALPTYNVELVYASEQGSVAADKALTNIVEGEKVTFTVTPSEGYRFSSIKVDDKASSYSLNADSKLTLTINKNFKMEVLFVLASEPVEPEPVLEEYDLTIQAENGTVLISRKDGQDMAQEGKVIEGVEYELTVTPAEGYHFSKIQFDGVDQNIALDDGKFDMVFDRSMVISAIFEQDAVVLQEFELELEAENGNARIDRLDGVAIEGNTVIEGVQYIVTVAPDEGYHFEEVLADGEPIIVALVNGQFKMTFDKSMTLSVVFAEDEEPEPVVNQYLVIVSKTKCDVTCAEVEGSVLTVEEDIEYTFTVTPEEGYELAEIQVNGVALDLYIEDNKFYLSFDKTSTLTVICRKVEEEPVKPEFVVELTADGLNIKAPVESTDAEDIAKVFETCSNIINGDTVEILGNVGNNYLESTIVFASLDGTFTSTTEVYESFQVVVKARQVLVEAINYAYNFGCAPYELMADIYYYLTQSK